MNIVEIDNVTKTFGEHVAVDGLSLAVPEGSIYGFIGPNGSGKTTTLRMIMRIYHPDPISDASATSSASGRIRVFGAETFQATNDRIGYLPEERGLYKRMKVGDVLRFYAELKGRRDFRHGVDSWLERLGLSEWKDKKVETLSKGMAQKVQFIAAVIADPDLVILDEPFSGLDPVNLDLLRDVVLELRKGGATIIFSTHDMAQAEKMCDFVFMIYKGKKVLDGTMDAIQANYGRDTIRVRVDDGSGAGRGVDYQRIAGVERVIDFGRWSELKVSADANSQAILADLMRQGRVDHFELTRPSLHDIFVRIAGSDAQASKEAGHA